MPKYKFLKRHADTKIPVVRAIKGQTIFEFDNIEQAKGFLKAFDWGPWYTPFCQRKKRKS